MANGYRGYVAIELDKPRSLKLGTNALVEIESLIGRKMTKLGDDIGISDLRIIIYCALKHEDKNMTLELAGDLIDQAESYEYLGEKVKEAMQASMKSKGKASDGAQAAGN